MTDIVECRSEIEYAERPVALFWNGQRLEVEVIEAQWRVPDGKRFRVRTIDKQIFELYFGEMNDEWHIHQP